MQAAGMHSTVSRAVGLNGRVVSSKLVTVKPSSQRASVKANVVNAEGDKFDITKQSEGDDIYALPQNQSSNAAYDGMYVNAGKTGHTAQRDASVEASYRGGASVYPAVPQQNEAFSNQQSHQTWSQQQHGAPRDGLQPDEFPLDKLDAAKQQQQQGGLQGYYAAERSEGLQGPTHSQGQLEAQHGEPPRTLEAKILAFRRLNQYMDHLHRDLDTFMDMFLPGLGTDRSYSPTMVAELLRGVPEELLPADGSVLSGGVRPGRKALEMEVHETDTEYALTANVPGYTKDEIKITLAANNVLTVAGEQEWEQLTTHADSDGSKEERFRSHQQQRRRWQASQSFVRCLWLPQNVDTNKLSATVENGVLTLKVPKKHPERPETAQKVITVF